MSAPAQIDWSKYAAPSGVTTAPQIDFSKYENVQAGQSNTNQPPAKTETPGVLAQTWQGIKNLASIPSGLYHAATDPATDQEKEDLLADVKKRNAAGEKIPEDIAINPSQATVVVHRMLTKPGDVLNARSDDELAKAKELWDSGEHFKAANLSTSGAVDKVLSYIPLVGPLVAGEAQKAESGRPIEAAVETAGMGAIEKAPEIAKMAKDTLPAASDIVNGGWRKIGNPMGLASTGQELLTQGISPRTSMSNWKPSVERAAGDLKAFDAQSKINSVQDLHEAIPEIKQKIWSEEIEPALQRQASRPVDMQPVADKVRAQISDEMKTFDEGNADKLETLAKKLEGARDVTSANKLLKYINGNLESYFQKFPAARKANLMNNPETAGWEAARSELRNQFLGTLEDAGETGVRDARLRYGAFDTLQDAVERRVNVADRAKPMSLGRIIGLAGAIPTGGLSVLAGELSNYLNKSDVLIRRGIAALPDTSVRTTPFPGAAGQGSEQMPLSNLFNIPNSTQRAGGQ